MRGFTAHIFIYFVMHGLVSRRVRTNEFVRTFDLYYVTRNNRRKHAFLQTTFRATVPKTGGISKNNLCYLQTKLNINTATN